jgi:hypothetical protein
MKKNENGFGVVEIIMAVAIIVLLGAVIYMAGQASQKKDNASATPTPSSTASSPTPSTSPQPEKSIASTSSLTLDNAQSRLQAAGLVVHFEGNEDSYYKSSGEVALRVYSINDHKAKVSITQFTNAQQAADNVKTQQASSSDTTQYTSGDLSVVITNDMNTGSTKPDSSLVAKIKSAL